MSSIMFVSTASSIGGMERVVCSLARGIGGERGEGGDGDVGDVGNDGTAVRTFFPEADNAEALLAWCADQGVDAETNPSVLDAAAPHSARSAMALRRLIREVDPDVVNIHYGDNFLSMWDVLGARGSGLRRPIAVTIAHPSEWTPASRRKRLMTTIGSRLVDNVSTYADATRDILRQAGVPASRIDVIPCGVAVPEHLVERVDARRALEVPPDAFVVSTLARLVEYKGVDKLITAMDCAELSGSILLVGGDGPFRSELERIAGECEHVDVRFVGRLPDVGVLFAASDLFALPSRLEGFGLVYVEAAMYGVPSIGTRVGGVPDAIADGETGLLVEPDDVDDLRRALVELVTDDERRNRMGAAARHRATTELDEATMVDRFAALFRRLRTR